MLWPESVSDSQHYGRKEQLSLRGLQFFIAVKVKIAIFGIVELARATADTSGILKTMVAKVAIVVVTFRAAWADAGASLVAMNRDLLGSEFDVVHALAAASATATDKIMVVTECIRGNFLQLGLVGDLSGRVGGVLGGRIDAAAFNIIEDSFGLLLGLGRLDCDVLEITTMATSSSVTYRSSTVTRVDNAGGAWERFHLGLDRSRRGLSVAAGRSWHKTSRLLLRLRCRLLR